MGTRSLICVYYQGKFAVAYYSQWDGYPEWPGQGIKILRFLEDPANVERLKRGIAHVWTLTGAEGNRLFDLIYDRTNHSYGPSCACKNCLSLKLFPMLFRDTGAEILEAIASATAEQRAPTMDSLSFVNDGISCEWAYVVDLDTDTFEIFQGAFDKEDANSDRFTAVGGVNDSVPALMKSFPFAELPSEHDDFIRAINKGIREVVMRMRERKWSRKNPEPEQEETK